jgi:hypothetical protein
MSDSSDPTTVTTKPPDIQMPQGVEWFWWGLLIVSLLVGFGMTIFAPI